MDADGLAEWMAEYGGKQLPDRMVIDLVVVLKRCAIVEVTLGLVGCFVPLDE